MRKPRLSWGANPSGRGSRHWARGIKKSGLAAALCAPALLAICVIAGPGVSRAQRAPAKFTLKTSTFRPGGDIPKQCTCDGSDVSPALSWSDPPAGTKSFALIVEDPDAPGRTFVHWVVYNLAPSTRQLAERVPKSDDLPDGGRQGVNDFPRTGYGGPCPPPGKPHRYFFRLYALDAKLDLKAQAHKLDVVRAMEGHILAEAELMGRYQR
jgi:Raf kinase inhibitor-like YbhB/YbcL family protein